MGDCYDIIYLGDKVYLEYHSADTNWENKVVELNQGHIDQLMVFERHQADETTVLSPHFRYQRQQLAYFHTPFIL